MLKNIFSGGLVQRKKTCLYEKYFVGPTQTASKPAFPFSPGIAAAAVGRSVLMVFPRPVA
jgi:hypothetical protein